MESSQTAENVKVYLFSAGFDPKSPVFGCSLSFAFSSAFPKRLGFGNCFSGSDFAPKSPCLGASEPKRPVFGLSSVFAPKSPGFGISAGLSSAFGVPNENPPEAKKCHA